MAKTLARSIRTKRDYKDATSLANRMRAQNEPETEEERRLQALLREIEKFDGDEADGDDDDDAGYGIDGVPRRRWSDDSADPE